LIRSFIIFFWSFRSEDVFICFLTFCIFNSFCNQILNINLSINILIFDLKFGSVLMLFNFLFYLLCFLSFLCFFCFVKFSFKFFIFFNLIFKSLLLLFKHFLALYGFLFCLYINLSKCCWWCECFNTCFGSNIWVLFINFFIFNCSLFDLIVHILLAVFLLICCSLFV